MSTLPSISGKVCISALKKCGFVIRRQKGSHIILRKENPFSQVVIPNHKIIDNGTLRAIIRQANLSITEFIELL